MKLTVAYLLHILWHSGLASKAIFRGFDNDTEIVQPGQVASLLLLTVMSLVGAAMSFNLAHLSLTFWRLAETNFVRSGTA